MFNKFFSDLEPASDISDYIPEFIVHPSWLGVVSGAIAVKTGTYISKTREYDSVKKMLNEVKEKDPEIISNVMLGIENKANAYTVSDLTALNYVQYILDFGEEISQRLPLVAQRILQAKELVKELLEYPHRLGYKFSQDNLDFKKEGKKGDDLARDILHLAAEPIEESFSEQLEAKFHPAGIRLERVLAFPNDLRNELLNNRIGRLQGVNDSRPKVVMLF